MQQYHLDPKYQTNISKRFDEFNQQMEMRKEKFFQIIDQLRQEFEFIKQNNTFPQFPKGIIEEIYQHVIQKFRFSMNQWIDLKKKAFEEKKLEDLKCFEEKKLKDHAEQQYVDSEFWEICLIQMNKHIQDICRENLAIRDVEDNNLLQGFMIVRFVLIMLKRTHKKQVLHSGYHTIVRAKAFIKHTEIHKELDRCLPSLHTTNWIKTQAALSKQKGKRAVKSSKFCKNLVKYLEIQYYKQYIVINQKFPDFVDTLTNIIPWGDKQKGENDICICYLLFNKSHQTDVSQVIEQDSKVLMEYFDGKDDVKENKKSEQVFEEKSHENAIEDNPNDDMNTIFSSLKPPFPMHNEANSVYPHSIQFGYFDDNYSTMPSTPMSHNSYPTNCDSRSIVSSSHMTLPYGNLMNMNIDNNDHDNCHNGNNMVNNMRGINNNNNCSNCEAFRSENVRLRDQIKLLEDNQQQQNQFIQFLMGQCAIYHGHTNKMVNVMNMQPPQNMHQPRMNGNNTNNSQQVDGTGNDINPNTPHTQLASSQIGTSTMEVTNAQNQINPSFNISMSRNDSHSNMPTFPINHNNSHNMMQRESQPMNRNSNRHTHIFDTRSRFQATSHQPIHREIYRERMNDRASQRREDAEINIQRAQSDFHTHYQQ